MGVTNFVTLPICDYNMDSVRNIRKVRCNDNAFACSGWHLHHVLFFLNRICRSWHRSTMTFFYRLETMGCRRAQVRPSCARFHG
jgi:hypothetical protein